MWFLQPLTCIIDVFSVRKKSESTPKLCKQVILKETLKQNPIFEGADATTKKLVLAKLRTVTRWPKMELQEDRFCGHRASIWLLTTHVLRTVFPRSSTRQVFDANLRPSSKLEGLPLGFILLYTCIYLHVVFCWTKLIFLLFVVFFSLLLFLFFFSFCFFFSVSCCQTHTFYVCLTFRTLNVPTGLNISGV